MPYEVVFSPVVDSQLEELEEYLAKRFYPTRAQEYVRRIVAACHSLGSAPFRGTMRDDLAEGMRTVGFERRATIYFKVWETRCSSWVFSMAVASRVAFSRLK